MDWDKDREELERDADFYRRQSDTWSHKVDEADDALGRTQAEKDHEDSRYGYRQDDED